MTPKQIGAAVRKASSTPMNLVQLITRITPTLRHRLRKKCKADKRSMNATVTMLIEQYIDKP